MTKSKVSPKLETCEPSLKELVKPIQADLALVEEQLGTNLIDDNPLINELLGVIFQAGGKRIRPMLVLYCSRATQLPDEPFSNLHIILSVLTELIHTASLVHDDILDSASLRRGSPTMNKRFNDRLAVLMGDLLFAQASICLARIMSPVIVGIYGQVLGDLCSGEIRQMKQQFSTVVNWQNYIDKSISKTASLFCAGARSSAILNQASAEIIAALQSFGLHFGICFQIIDDLLDFTGTANSLGKEPGSDLKAGIITAPALFILERKDKSAQILESLITSRKICESEGLEEGLRLITDGGGIDAAADLALKHAQIAKEHLGPLPNTIYKEHLAQLVEYVLQRAN